MSLERAAAELAAESGANPEQQVGGESGVCDLHVRVDGSAERVGDNAAGVLRLVS